jgi:hypothetical protein
VRHDDGDPAGGRAAGRVAHHQQLDQVLLDGGDQRLDEKDVPLSAVGLELHLQAVVGEPADPDRVERHAEMPADLRRQFGVGATAEHGDVSHVRSSHDHSGLPPSCY